MAISSIERRGSFYDLFDERGGKFKTMADTAGELLGWSSTFFILFRGSFYYMFNEFGERIATLSSSFGTFVSITGDDFIRKGPYLYTFDKFGKRMGSPRPVR